jgi:hypothetical protein
MPRGIHHKKDDPDGAAVPVLSLARLLARQAAAELVAADQLAPSSLPIDNTTENADAGPQN